MDKFEMTPEQQLAFDGFIDIMVQIYIGCLLMRKDSGSLPGYYEERNQSRGSHGGLVQVSAVILLEDCRYFLPETQKIGGEISFEQ